MIRGYSVHAPEAGAPRRLTGITGALFIEEWRAVAYQQQLQRRHGKVTVITPVHLRSAGHQRIAPDGNLIDKACTRRVGELRDAHGRVEGEALVHGAHVRVARDPDLDQWEIVEILPNGYHDTGEN